jgi:hypothetical protein
MPFLKIGKQLFVTIILFIICIRYHNYIIRRLKMCTNYECDKYQNSGFGGCIFETKEGCGINYRGIEDENNPENCSDQEINDFNLDIL